MYISKGKKWSILIDRLRLLPPKAINDSLDHLVAELNKDILYFIRTRCSYFIFSHDCVVSTDISTETD